MDNKDTEYPVNHSLTHALEALLGGLGHIPDVDQESKNDVEKKDAQYTKDIDDAGSFSTSNEVASPSCTEKVCPKGDSLYKAKTNNPTIPGLFLCDDNNTSKKHIFQTDLSNNTNNTSQEHPPEKDLSNDKITPTDNIKSQIIDNAMLQVPAIEITKAASPTLTTSDLNSDKKQDENMEWQIDSSPIQSASDEDNLSDDSSSSEEGEDSFKLLTPEEQARILMAGDSISDDECGDKLKGPGGQLRTKNEILEVVIPKPEVSITEDMTIVELGVVEQIVNNIVLIKANVSGEYRVLESGSVLCLSDRSVLGVIAETMGRVEQPFYSIMFTNATEISNFNLSIGVKILYPENHATYVFTKSLKALKGSDASNINDEEVGDDEIEFSDDEAEAEHKRRVKQKRQDRRGEKISTNDGFKRPHIPSQKSQGEAEGVPNVSHEDDEEDEPYKPLVRPAGFADHISRAEAPPENAVTTERVKKSAGEKRKNRGRANRNRQGGSNGRNRGRQNRRNMTALTSNIASYQQGFEPSIGTVAYPNPNLNSHSNILSQNIPTNPYDSTQYNLNLSQFQDYDHHQPCAQQWPPLFGPMNPFPQLNAYQPDQNTFNNWVNMPQPLPNGAFINPAFFNRQLGPRTENQQNHHDQN